LVPRLSFPGRARRIDWSFRHRPTPATSSAFHIVFAELGLSDRDDILALRIARRIIELAVRGERDPERLKAVVLAWVMK
jgi:hypothetical protein